MTWKNWPYWLKGGIICGGVALAFQVALFSCLWVAEIGLKPGEVGFSFWCLAFGTFGPMFPVGKFIIFLAPIFGYDAINVYSYTIFLTIPIWFIIGSAAGYMFKLIKRNERQYPLT